jgi:hypothetical protein
MPSSKYKIRVGFLIYGITVGLLARAAGCIDWRRVCVGSRFFHVEWWGDAVEGGASNIEICVEDGRIAVSLNVEPPDTYHPADTILHLMNFETSQGASTCVPGLLQIIKYGLKPFYI